MNYLRKMDCCYLEPVVFKNKRLFLIINILIPIIVGAVFYYIYSPNVVFVKVIDELVGGGLHLEVPDESIIWRLVRNYCLDMLWGYAIVFALYLLIDNDSAKLKVAFLLAFAMSVVIELLQLISVIRGTFDVIDIISMCFAQIIAVFIINKTLGGKSNEKG